MGTRGPWLVGASLSQTQSPVLTRVPDTAASPMVGKAGNPGWGSGGRRARESSVRWFPLAYLNDRARWRLTSAAKKHKIHTALQLVNWDPNPLCVEALLIWGVTS